MKRIWSWNIFRQWTIYFRTMLKPSPTSLLATFNDHELNLFLSFQKYMFSWVLVRPVASISWSFSVSVGFGFLWKYSTSTGNFSDNVLRLSYRSRLNQALVCSFVRPVICDNFAVSSWEKIKMTTGKNPEFPGQWLKIILNKVF